MLTGVGRQPCKTCTGSVSASGCPVKMSCCEEDDHLSGLHETVLKLPKLGWYYGNISVEEAESILEKEPNGSFLVRDTNDTPKHTELYTITFKLRGRCGSVRIEYAKGYFTLSLADPGLPLFRTMMDLIGYCYNRSVVQKKPVCILSGHHNSRDLYLFLKKPVDRHTKMHSLQHFCRLSIHSYVTLDKMPKLPLPRHLKEGYIMQNPLFDEDLHGVAHDDLASETSSTSELDLQTKM